MIKETKEQIDIFKTQCPIFIEKMGQGQYIFLKYINGEPDAIMGCECYTPGSRNCSFSPSKDSCQYLQWQSLKSSRRSGTGTGKGLSA